MSNTIAPNSLRGLPLKISRILLLVLFSAMPVAASWAGVAKFGRVPDRRADLAAKALGVKLTQGGFSKPYGEALAAFTADRADLQKKTELFVAAVGRGASPAAVYRLAVASSNIAAERTIEAGCKTWPYGSAAHEIEFANWLLAKAQLLARAGHRAKAAAWAKAALFASLAAAFPSQNLSLIEIFAWHGKELRGLLGLSPAQFAALSAVAISKKPGPGERALMAMNLYHDGFLHAKRVDEARLRKLLDLSGIISRKPRGCGVLDEFTIISVDWQVLNMARAWRDRKAVGLLDDYFKRLARDQRPEISLWARQALREIGPVPLPNMVEVRAARPRT